MTNLILQTLQKPNHDQIPQDFVVPPRAISRWPLAFVRARRLGSNGPTSTSKPACFEYAELHSESPIMARS
jgi:hypothetical protein